MIFLEIVCGGQQVRLVGFVRHRQNPLEAYDMCGIGSPRRMMPCLRKASAGKAYSHFLAVAFLHSNFLVPRTGVEPVQALLLIPM